MKFNIYKFISLALLLVAGNISVANARPTEGNYLIVKLSQNNINANVQVNDIVGDISGGTSTTQAREESPIASTNHSLGIALNRSLRLNKFDIFDIHLITEDLSKVYLNYGLFYDHLNYTNYANNTYNFSIKNRYGAYVGAGYDITPKHAIYINYGLSSINYEVDTRTSLTASGINNGTENNRTVAPIISLGFNYKILNDILLGLEYSRQKVDLEAVTSRSNSGIGNNNSDTRTRRYDFSTEIETFSLNLIYHFTYD